MNEFLTWSFLATFAGCVTGTGIAVQFLKDISFIKKIPTQLFAWIVSFIILNVATYFVGDWTLSFGALSIINAGIISLAANGGYEAVSKIFDKFMVNKAVASAEDESATPDEEEVEK